MEKKVTDHADFEYLIHKMQYANECEATRAYQFDRVLLNWSSSFDD